MARDPPGLRPSALSQDRPDNTDQVAKVGRFDFDSILTFPAPDAPDGAQGPEDLDTANLVGTLRPGSNHFDFSTGTVTLPDGTEFQMSAGLNDLDSEYIRSLYIFADDHVQWALPEKNASKFLYQTRNDKITSTQITEMEVFAFDPCEFQVFASVDDRIALDPEGLTRSSIRVSIDDPSPLDPPPGPPVPNDADPRVVVGNEWEKIPWTTEWDTIKPSPSSSDHLHAMNFSEASLSVSVYDELPGDVGTYGGDPVQIAWKMNHTETRAGIARRVEQLSPMEGHAPDDNVIVYPPGFDNPDDDWIEAPWHVEFDVFPHHYVELEARSIGEESVLMGAGTFITG